MSNDLLNPLNNILERVQSLVELARTEQWEELNVAANEYQQCAAILDDGIYLKNIQAGNVVEEAKLIIAKIQATNEELDVYTTLQRDKVASELRQILQAGKALDAYGR